MSFLCYVRHEFPKVVCHPQKESHFTDISGLLHSFDSAHLVGVCADPCYTDDLPKELNSAVLKTHTSHSFRVFAAASSRPRLDWLPQMSTSSMWHTTPKGFASFFSTKLWEFLFYSLAISRSTVAAARLRNGSLIPSTKYIVFLAVSLV